MSPDDPHARNLVAGAVMDAHGEWVPLSLRYRIAEKVLETLAPLIAETVRAAQETAWAECQKAWFMALACRDENGHYRVPPNPYRVTEKGDEHE